MAKYTIGSSKGTSPLWLNLERREALEVAKGCEVPLKGSLYLGKRFF
jgi:hypothetical protein